MKEIKMLEPVYIEQFDIKVNPYLNYAQIQQIVNATINNDNWAERAENIDMLIAYHATDIGKEKLEELGPTNLLESGLMDIIKSNIKNLNKVYEAIEYNESIQRSLTQILKELPKYFEPLEKVLSKHGNKI